MTKSYQERASELAFSLILRMAVTRHGGCVYDNQHEERISAVPALAYA